MANLTQLKTLETLNGFLLVDKPAGIPFSSVVKAVKRKFNLIKVGHGGALDAMASGLFVLLIGDANQFGERVMNADREYEGVIKFGLTTNTGDKYGIEVETASPKCQLADLRGDVFLSEPRFAAIRKEGSAEYEVVDTGNHPQVMGHIYRFQLNGTEEERNFSLLASKQVIPRAIAIELGVTLISLRRTKLGRFSVADAIAFAQLLELNNSAFVSRVQPLSFII